ncbi:hypothetical protein SESBI_41680 [Sesbania bispinosa]|nr:hypothetical protein SESBI_41680 [Sesbania bispinosa]
MYPDFLNHNAKNQGDLVTTREEVSAHDRLKEIGYPHDLMRKSRLGPASCAAGFPSSQLNQGLHFDGLNDEIGNYERSGGFGLTHNNSLAHLSDDWVAAETRCPCAVSLALETLGATTGPLADASPIDLPNDETRSGPEVSRPGIDEASGINNSAEAIDEASPSELSRNSHLVEQCCNSVEADHSGNDDGVIQLADDLSLVAEQLKPCSEPWNLQEGGGVMQFGEASRKNSQFEELLGGWWMMKLYVRCLSCK